MQPFIVEKPGGSRLRHYGEGLEQTLVVGVIDKAAHGSSKQSRYGQQPASHFLQSRAEENVRVKWMNLGLVPDKDPAQLRRRHLISQVGRYKRASVNAHIDIKVIEIQPIQRLIQRPECTYFINSTQRATPTEREPDAWRWL
jgi:hypothetical protein